MTAILKLTRGMHALVDDADHETLSAWKWFAVKGRRTCYAVRTVNATATRPASRIAMHRWIDGAPTGVFVDHRDGNGLNNQRSNLRRATNAQNCRNSPSRGGSSQFKGVSFHKGIGKWTAHIRVGGTQLYLGAFVEETDAGRAYDAAALTHFGAFARLNFPETIAC